MKRRSFFTALGAAIASTFVKGKTKEEPEQKNFIIMIGKEGQSTIEEGKIVKLMEYRV